MTTIRDNSKEENSEIRIRQSRFLDINPFFKKKVSRGALKVCLCKIHTNFKDCCNTWNLLTISARSHKIRHLIPQIKEKSNVTQVRRRWSRREKVTLLERELRKKNYHRSYYKLHRIRDVFKLLLLKWLVENHGITIKIL